MAAGHVWRGARSVHDSMQTEQQEGEHCTADFANRDHTEGEDLNDETYHARPSPICSILLACDHYRQVVIQAVDVAQINHSLIACSHTHAS